MLLFSLLITPIHVSYAIKATAVILRNELLSGEPNKYPTNVLGTLSFEETGYGSVKLTGELNGLTPGLHAFNINELGDLVQGCQNARRHYNPTCSLHGGISSTERHVGDLGNIEADYNGRSVIDIEDKTIQLTGQYSILGRAVMVFASADDMGLGGDKESLITGNSGAPVGCGVVGIASRGYSPSNAQYQSVQSYKSQKLLVKKSESALIPEIEGPCEDHETVECSDFVISGKCEITEWRTYMVEYCRKSCKFC